MTTAAIQKTKRVGKHGKQSSWMKTNRTNSRPEQNLKMGVRAAYKLGVMDGEESMMKRLRVMRVAIKRMSEVLKEDPRNYRISSVRLGMKTARKILHCLQQDDNTHTMDLAQLLNSRIAEAIAAERVYTNFNKRKLDIVR